MLRGTTLFRLHLAMQTSWTALFHLPDAVMGEPSAAYSPISRREPFDLPCVSVRISGKAFTRLPRALPPTGRSLCGTGSGYSCPVIEYNGILSQPIFSVKHNSAIFHGVV